MTHYDDMIAVSIDDKPIDDHFQTMSRLAIEAGFTSAARHLNVTKPFGGEAIVRNRDTGVSIIVRVEDTNLDRGEHDATEIMAMLMVLVQGDPLGAKGAITGEGRCDDCGRRCGWHDPEVEH
jgi:hypothetical protein